MKLFGGFVFILALVIVPPSAAWAQSGSGGALEIEGIYACEGSSPKGEAYRGTVQIVRHADTYRVFWRLGTDEGNVGVGIRSGDVLAVSYFDMLPAVVVYKVERTESGPRLVGKWTVLGADDKVFSETLTKLEHPPSAEPPATRPRSPRRPPPPPAFTPIVADRVAP
jgi:hypothetical protein